MVVIKQSNNSEYKKYAFWLGGLVVVQLKMEAIDVLGP